MVEIRHDRSIAGARAAALAALVALPPACFLVPSGLDVESSSTGSQGCDGGDECGGNGGAGAGTSSGDGGGGASPGPPPDWYDPAWLHRRPITIHHEQVESDLVSFAVVIHVADAALLGGLQPDADDLVVTAEDGKTKLSHEIELLSATDGVWFWVGLPELSALADTRLWLYYGNGGCSNQQDPAGVWDSDSDGVWHLGEAMVDGASDGVHVDSTGHDRHAVQRGNRDVPGRLGRAQQLDGADHIEISQPQAFVLGDADCTVSAWIKTAGSQDMGILLKSDGANHEPGDKLFGVNHTPTALGIDHGWVTYLGGSSSVIDDEWHHVVWTQEMDASGGDERWSLYVDGALQAEKLADTMPDLPGHTLRIGAYVSSSYFAQAFVGAIDEVHISRTARSSAWVGTAFANQRDPGIFSSIGDEETLP